MGLSYSDVDEMMGSASTYEDISDYDYENESVRHFENQSKEELDGERQNHPGMFDSNIHMHQNYQSRRCVKKSESESTLPVRQRRSSDISDFSYSDNESINPQEVLDSSLNTRLPVNESEVGDLKRSSELSFPNSLSHGHSDSVVWRKNRPRNNRQLSSSGVSDVDESPSYTSKKNPTKTRKNKYRKRRSLRTSPISSDFGISASDVDESGWNFKENNTGVEEEASETTGDAVSRESNDDGSAPEQFGSTNVIETINCEICCDVDSKTTRCELCERAICETCMPQHFDMHAAEVTARLENLNKLMHSIRNELPPCRIMAEVDDVAEELVAAGNKAIERAFSVYQVASNECTSVIGSLVDRRIKISASIKFLIRQIPTVLHSEDLCELLYFKNVFKGVEENLAELAIATTDPKSKEVEKLEITSTFSPTGPLLGPNSLILSLGNFDYCQGQSESQTKLDLLSQPWTDMHFSNEHQFEN
ncbi:hypothetical protein Aperf_G00000131152 [Anoplocephala perfoliata]